MSSLKLRSSVAMLSCLTVALATGGYASASPPSPSSARPLTVSVDRHLDAHGVVNVRALGAVANHRSAPTDQTYQLRPDGNEPAKAAPRAAVPTPNPSPVAITTSSGGVAGFVGITDLTQSLADNGNQFTVEPPDQGLCAHAGVIVEAVNNGLQVFTSSHVAVTPVIALNRFFHLPSEVDRSFSPPSFGPFLSDPRCYYDPQTARWFVTELEIDLNPLTGQFGFRSAEYLAVSQTSDPAGNYAIFSLDTTNDGSNGTPREPNCPCFGDQPRIGADANGFYISTDSYSIAAAADSNGGELYAVSKARIVAAADGSTKPVAFVAIQVGAIFVGGHPANALQPATTPEGAAYAQNTEYFLSTPDFNGFATSGGVGARSVLVWALRNTASLNSTKPRVTLSMARAPSEPYAPPVPATQRPGPRPLGTADKAPLPKLSTNDDRMQQVEYVKGHLYSSLNTGVGGGGKANRSGIAWFQVKPTVTAQSLTAVVSRQGYIAAGQGSSLMYPAIGLNSAAAGAMVFSISGPRLYPSAAYVRFGSAGVSGAIHINGPGAAPEDGFSCYKAEGGGPTCRWGDYSAATSDGRGHIVMATEMIPNSPRSTFANWGTFISVLSL